MRQKKRTPFGKNCLLLGIGLAVIATAAVLLWQRNLDVSGARVVDYAQRLLTVIPKPQGAVPESRTDNTMPAFSLEGTDFIGILELPRYGSVLPVGAQWGQQQEYPCCFSGSVYDRSMQIGATSRKGQYDFYREISVGDEVFFTDMTGNCYSYIVKDIRYVKQADQAALNSEDAALKLFIKNVYGFQNILLFCELSG